MLHNYLVIYKTLNVYFQAIQNLSKSKKDERTTITVSVQQH